MVIGTVLGLWLCSQAPEAIGAVRIARGEVRSCEGAELETLLRQGDCVEVRDGWSELMIGAHVRIRLSAATRVRFEPGRIAVERGRAWIEVGGEAAVDLVVGQVRARIAPRSAAIADVAGGTLAVRSGRADIDGEGAEEGYIAVFRDGRTSIQLGGAETAALVRKEARSGLGDLAGWRAFLLSAAREAPIRRPPFVGEIGPPRALTGRNGAGALYEEALRPPPFFPGEIPPPGPNVRVEVEFDE